MFQSLLFTLALFLLLTVPSGAHGSFVYVTNYGDGTISQFRANLNGTLTPLNPPAVKAWPRCHSLAADPSGRFLYVLSALEFSCRDCVVSQFRIGNDGGLTPLSPSTVPVSAMGSGPSLIVVNPTGPAVYTMGRGSETTTFRIESHGHLVPLTPIATANAGITGPDVQLTFHPSLPLLYRAYQGAAPGPGEMTAGGVDVLAFRADGQILDKPVQKLNMDGNTPLGVMLVRDGRHAYIPHNWNSVPKISQYQILPTGALLPLAPANVSLPAYVSQALADPQSRFLYIIARTANTSTAYTRIIRYRIEHNGRLGKDLTQKLSLRAAVKSTFFSSDGKFFYLLTGNGVRTFRVRANGSVSPLQVRSTRAGREPLGMVCVQK